MDSLVIWAAMTHLPVEAFQHARFQWTGVASDAAQDRISGGCGLEMFLPARFSVRPGGLDCTDRRERPNEPADRSFIRLDRVVPRPGTLANWAAGSGIGGIEGRIEYLASNDRLLGVDMEIANRFELEGIRRLGDRDVFES